MSALSDRISSFAEALAADQNLASWCQTAYGRPPKIFINIDSRNPPKAEDCPYIIFRPAIARIGNARQERVAQNEMVCCLHDESFRTYADNAIIEYNGVRNLIDFMQLAIRAIAAVDIGNEVLELLEPEFDTIDSFPFFISGLPLATSEGYTLGADRLAL